MIREQVPDGFVFQRRFRMSREGSVSLAKREGDGQSVVLKTFSGQFAGADRARREFSALQRIAHPKIAQAIELIDYLPDPVLVLRYVPGTTLREWLASAGPSLRSVLDVACQLAAILIHLHERRFAHRDLTPDNIIVEPSTLDTHLIDFGLSRPLGSAATTHEQRHSRRRTLRGALSFIAPEQTGRMNRGWDLRSDLYTLGATLYYALTGRPPFEGNDRELLHAHIAREPRDPRELRRDLPLPISRLVLKLLQKEPDERYASAALLHADLVSLRDCLQSTGSISDDVALSGLGVSSAHLAFSKQLYGRDAEQARLESLFARVAAGESHATLISGPAGAGKSALVNALRPKIAAAGGYLAFGKFDRYRPRPYSAWIAALHSLTDQLLVLSDVELERLRQRLLEELGKVAQALVDLLPDLALILGEVPPVPRLGPRETQERLALALERAVRVLARPEQPLVVLLDDLHAADPESLFLTESILCSSPAPGAFLFIGTYRQDEIAAEHPLPRWIEQLRARGVSLEALQLNPLTHEAVVQFLSTVLGRSRDEVQSLARQVETKTANSPFVIREFLENLHARGLLQRTGSSWSWDSDAVRSVALPEGGVELVLARIQRLAPDVISILRFASCVGDEFDLPFLVELGGGRHSEVEGALFALADAGLIVPSRAGFRFAHDRIREAAQALLGEDERERLHYETGAFLLERTPEEQLDERAALLAEHLNQGRRWLPEELRIRLIWINLLAGQRALRSGAPQAATDYFAVAHELLREPDWTAQRDISLSVELSVAEAEFQCARYDRALARLDALDSKTLAVLEKVQVQIKRILIFALTRPPEEAAAYALGVLREYGFRWRLHPSKIVLYVAMLRARRALRTSRFGLDWKPATAIDARWFVPLVLSGAFGGIASRVDIGLSSLLSCRAMRTYTRHGFIGNPGFALACTALAEISVGRDPKRALRASEAALEWKNRISDPGHDLRLELVVHGLVYPWLMARRKALASLTRMAQQAHELGDREFAYYAGINQNVYLALGGETIPEMDQRFRELADGVLRAGHRYSEAVPCHRLHELLLLQHDVDAQVEARVCELEREVAALPASGAVYFRTLCLQVLCVYGRYDLAFEQSEKIWGDLFRVVPFVHVADHTFYRGLAAAVLASRASGTVRRRYLLAFRQSARLLSGWVRWGPDFPHMFAFLQAEGAQLRGKPKAARALYDRAAQGAQRQGFVHHAALAYERKAELFAQSRRATEHALAQRDAASLYARWGCPAKGTASSD